MKHPFFFIFRCKKPYYFDITRYLYQFGFLRKLLSPRRRRERKEFFSFISNIKILKRCDLCPSPLLRAVSLSNGVSAVNNYFFFKNLKCYRGSYSIFYASILLVFFSIQREHYSIIPLARFFHLTTCLTCNKSHQNYSTIF